MLITGGLWMCSQFENDFISSRPFPSPAVEPGRNLCKGGRNAFWGEA
jgi:hypothetical protein